MVFIYFIHFIVQLSEKHIKNVLLPDKDIKKGIVTNYVTTLYYMFPIVCISFYNSIMGNQITTIQIEKSMIDYFIYDTLFCLYSRYRGYFIFLIHHIFAISILTINSRYSYSTPFLTNSIIFLLEFGGLFTNLYKLRLISKKVLTRIYFITRIVLLNTWITIFAITRFKFEIQFMTTLLLFLGIYYGSVQWYFKLI